MAYFTDDNTDGFTAAELAKLNERVDEILADIEDPDSDDIKNACDKANNEFVRR